MTKEEVVFLKDVEIPICEEDGWRLIYHKDFFNEHEWFDIQYPDGEYSAEEFDNIYGAIEVFNLTVKIFNSMKGLNKE